MENLSFQPATGSTDYGPMPVDETDWNNHYAGAAALVAAIAAAIGSVIYASKHIRHSECLGTRCDQDVVVEQVQPKQVQQPQSAKQRLETSL